MLPKFKYNNQLLETWSQQIRKPCVSQTVPKQYRVINYRNPDKTPFRSLHIKMYTTSRLQIPIFKISTRLREILETDPCQNLTSPWLKNTYFYQCKHFYSLQTREEQSHNTDVLERLWYCLLQHYLFHFSLLFSKITYGVRRICRIKQGHLASPNTNIIQSDVLGFFK